MKRGTKERAGGPITMDEARTVARNVRKGVSLDKGHAAWVIEQLILALEGKPNHVQLPVKATDESK